MKIKARKNDGDTPDWLIKICSMPVCSYCGVIAGACLSPANCPKELNIEDAVPLPVELIEGINMIHVRAQVNIDKEER